MLSVRAVSECELFVAAPDVRIQRGRGGQPTSQRSRVARLGPRRRGRAGRLRLQPARHDCLQEVRRLLP